MPQIESIGVLRLTIPLRGVFRISYSAEATAETLLVAVRLNDGTIGFGEASPSTHVTWENLAAAEAYVERVAARLKGLHLPGELGLALKHIHSIGFGFSSARAALESAVLDATAKLAGVSLDTLLGGRLTEKLYTDYTVSIPDPDTLRYIVEGRGRAYEAYAESIEYLVGLRTRKPEDTPIPLPDVSGFRVLKVKVGTGSPEADEALVLRAYEASRGKARLRIDANQAWTPKQAVKLVSRLENRLGDLLELVEQPVPAWNLEGLWYVREHVETPVAADESARNIVEAARVAAMHAADVVNIKIMKAGGPLQAARIAATVSAHGLRVMWGCMVETSLGIAQAVHPAASSEATAYIDLDSPLFLREEPMEKLLAYQADSKGVAISVPREPGLGVKPSSEVVGRFRWV